MSVKGKSKKATIKFTTRANTFPNAAGKGEWFGTVIPNGTLDQEGLIDRMIAHGCKLERTTIRYFLDQLMRTVPDVMAETNCSVDLGFCRLRPVIRGSFESEDEAFDKKRHKLVIEATLSPAIRKAVAEGLEAVNVTPVETPSPCIDSVCYGPDFVRNTLSVAAPFEVHGTGLTVRHGDETAELALPSGGSLAVSLKRQTKEDGAQRVKAQLAEPPPSPCPKRARLILRTHGLGGAGAPLFTVKSASLKLLP